MGTAAGPDDGSGWLDDLPWVISVDDHVVEPPHLWQRWLPAKYRDRGPRVELESCTAVTEPGTDVATRFARGGDGPAVEWWIYEGTARPVPMVMACAGIPPEDLHAGPIAYADMRPGCYDPAARLADMDTARIERSLCFPAVIRFAGQMFLRAEDKEVALASVRAYNDWMVEEWCGGSGGRLIPLCIVPLWDPEAAAAEVRRNAARGARAITFTELPANLGLPSIHDPRRHWEPLFEACDETGTVICMHIGSGSKMPRTSDDAPAGVTVALTSVNAYLAMVDWLLSGALARFPALRIAFSESQVGWIPFVMERVDQIFIKSRAWAEVPPEIDELPSSYVAGRVYGCFFDDMVGVDLRHHIGIGQLVFETDYPHQDSTWPDTPKLVEEIAGRVPRHELEMLVRTNAIEMLRLDPGDLAPAATTGDPR